MKFRSESDEPISEHYRLAGERWADLEAAAQLLEDTKSAVMAQWQLEQGDIPVNRAEQTVKASPRWVEYVTKVVEARKAANKAKVYLRSVEMRAWEVQAKDANQRTELKILGR